jgi:hypothetical protein
LIERLGLLPQPEGGYYSATYRSTTMVATPRGERCASTAIYQCWFQDLAARGVKVNFDFLPGVNGGDSFYAAHGDASAIGWVGASQPAAIARVDLCAAPRPF